MFSPWSSGGGEGLGHKMYENWNDRLSTGVSRDLAKARNPSQRASPQTPDPVRLSVTLTRTELGEPRT